MSSRQRAMVSNAMFFKILDHVGFKSKENQDVLEQLLPLEYFITNEFVETNRKEVRSFIAFKQYDHLKI